MSRLRPLIFTFLFVIAVTTQLSGEDFLRPTRIGVLSVPAEGASESSIGNVILNASVLQFVLQDFEVNATESEADLKNLKEQDYLLRSEYRITGDQVSIAVKVTEAGSETLSVSTRWEGSLSIDLDDEIQTIIKTEIVPFLPTTIEVSRSQTEKAAEAGAAWAILALTEESENIPVEQNDDPEARSVTGSANKWVLDIGGLVYIPLADTATWAKIGYGGRLAFGYSFGMKSVDLIPRLTVSAVWLPTDTFTNTDLLFIPLGLELKIVSASPVLAPYGRIGGGATWLMILTENNDNDGKIVPFVEAGLGIDIKLGDKVGLILDVAFSAQIEESVVLYGIVPGLSLGFRF